MDPAWLVTGKQVEDLSALWSEAVDEARRSCPHSTDTALKSGDEALLDKPGQNLPAASTLGGGGAFSEVETFEVVARRETQGGE